MALNGATTMHADLVTDIKAASSAGFELIEIWAAKLRIFLKEYTTADLHKLLKEYNLEPYSINSIEHITFRNETDYSHILTECEELSAIANEIGCPFIVVVPGKLPENATKDVIMAESCKVLKELGEIAGKHNVSLAFEFLGQNDCSVQTLDLCNEIVEMVNQNNIGIVLDSFHFFAGNSSFEAIDKLKPEKLFIFHINDAENLPKEKLTDANRLYPGLGVLPLKEIKSSLDNIGYNRMASIEIFRPEYWNQNPYEVAKLAKYHTEKVLGLV